MGIDRAIEIAEDRERSIGHDRTEIAIGPDGVPLFEGIVWNQHFGVQAWIKALTGEEFHDFAGSIVAP